MNTAIQNLNASMLKPLEHARVLVVDDQPQNIQVIYQMLSGLYHVFMATSGQQAIEFCLNDPPDLVLMDVVMPDMDGLETCKKMKRHAELHAIPVIFVTALDEQHEENACWEAGGIDFLSKPVNSMTLKNRVKAQLTLKFQTDLLREMAYLDGLTGVYNRRYFDDYYHRQIGLARRNGHSLSLLMIDIDFFKQFNDGYGHLAGDDCLKEVALCLKKQLHRPGDMLARYGGEEFACILPDSDIQGSLYVAENMRSAVEKLDIPHLGSLHKVVTISIGLASLSEHMELSEIADSRLYQAKEKGRNQVVGD